MLFIQPVSDSFMAVSKEVQAPDSSANQKKQRAKSVYEHTKDVMGQVPVPVSPPRRISKILTPSEDLTLFLSVLRNPDSTTQERLHALDSISSLFERSGSQLSQSDTTSALSTIAQYVLPLANQPPPSSTEEVAAGCLAVYYIMHSLAAKICV
jgi:hypothetical protein